MNALQCNDDHQGSNVKSDTNSVEEIKNQFIKFEEQMEELKLLKEIADELKSFRRMIWMKKYD